MMWEIRREGECSYLAGTAHFFPYHFRGSLRRYISRVGTVLFEGPLDDDAARRVAEAGSRGDGGVSLREALTPQTIGRISQDFRSPWASLSSYLLYREVLAGDRGTLDWDRLAGLKPWMAFFQIWSHYLRKNGWTYTIELDALRIAVELGKEAHFLETIEEQLEALNNVPLERIVHFLENVDWRSSRRDYLQCYLNGDLEGLMARVKDFPTLCESIIAKRDPILYERMKPYLEKGSVMAFVGTSHCRGIRAMLRADGCWLGPPPGLPK